VCEIDTVQHDRALPAKRSFWAEWMGGYLSTPGSGMRLNNTPSLRQSYAQVMPCDGSFSLFSNNWVDSNQVDEMVQA